MANIIIDDEFFDQVEKRYNQIVEHTTKGVILNKIEFTFPRYKEQAIQRGQLNYEIGYYLAKLKKQQKNFYKKNDSKETKLKKMFNSINMYNNLMDVVNKYNNLKDILPTKEEVIEMVKELNDELIQDYKRYLWFYYNQIEYLYDNFDCNRIIYLNSKTIKKKHQKDCPICLNNVEIGVKTKCGHLFHCDCLGDFFTNHNGNNMNNITIRPKCPLCRQEICFK